MEEGVTSTNLIAFQEQRVHETEKKNRDKNNFERISGDDGERGDYKLEEDLGGGSAGGGGGGGGGGIINDIISNLLQQSTEAKQGEEDKGNQREEKLNDVKTEEEGGGGGGVGVGGGGIIQTLVSHLPKNLLDDIAPPPDEASILIHSVVHD